MRSISRSRTYIYFGVVKLTALVAAARLGTRRGTSGPIRGTNITPKRGCDEHEYLGMLGADFANINHRLSTRKLNFAVSSRSAQT